MGVYFKEKTGNIFANEDCEQSRQTKLSKACLDLTKSSEGNGNRKMVQKDILTCYFSPNILTLTFEPHGNSGPKEIAHTFLWII